MTVGYLASHESQVQMGYLLAMAGIPAIGLICLAIGLVERSRSRRQAPPYPPQYPMASGYPVNTGYRYPPTQPAYSRPHLGPPYAGYHPRPRTPKSVTTLITIGVVLLTLGALNILAQMAQLTSNPDGGTNAAGQSPPASPVAEPEIGQCFSEFEAAMGSLNAPTDCADPVATYELAAKVGPTATCPDNKADDSRYSRLTNKSRRLCFAANLQQGQCYLRTGEHTTTTWTPADCAQARYAKFKVDKRIDGSTDDTPCPPGDTTLTYPVPARVYCLARAG